MSESVLFSESNGKIWFLALCVELYKHAKNMSGAEAYNYLNQKGAVKFIIESWDALHTTSQGYIIDSIDEYIKNSV